MGLFDKLFGEFVDIIEWTDNSNDTMVYRFERYGNEIKYGAKLTVRESQVAVFVNEGELADVLTPGLYILETKNLPALSTLQHWDHGFQSPFKAEVYFCSTRRFVDLKWGTKNPLMLRDPEFGAVRLRTFGTYAVRIADPVKFMREIVGTDGHFTVDEISNQLRNLIVSRYANIIGGANIPVLDLAANYDQLGEFITARIAPEFSDYGVELTKVLVENISLPPDVEQALDKRTSMGMVGGLDKYIKYQSAEALEAGAKNPSGAASEGIGIGAGFAMAKQLGETLNTSTSSASSGAPPDAPPPLPQVQLFHVADAGKPTGPFTLEQIKQKTKTGTLTSRTLVWTKGMQEWQPAEELAALAAIFTDDEPSPPILPE